MAAERYLSRRIPDLRVGNNIDEIDKKLIPASIHPCRHPVNTYNRAIIGPPLKRHPNDILLAGRQWPEFGCWLTHARIQEFLPEWSRPDCQKTALTTFFVFSFQWFISKKTIFLQGFGGGGLSNLFKEGEGAGCPNANSRNP